MEPIKSPIRILVVEDSLVCRELLIKIFQNAPDFQVVGAARDGAEALRLARRLQPDVITMDIHMPNLNGYEATQRIMEETPRPIIMVTNSLKKNEVAMTFNALEAGALSILNKPTINDPPEVYHYLLAQVRLMSEVRVLKRWLKPAAKNGAVKPAASHSAKVVDRPSPRHSNKIELVTMAASTGGPGALNKILSQLPADFAAPILIVQHISAGFGDSLAAWLNSHTSLTVRITRDGDRPSPGEALLAPDGYHLAVRGNGRVVLTAVSPQQNLQTAADHLFHSVAQIYGNRAIGVILTGMGHDGAAGLKAMREAGAYTIAQDQQTCVVFGMPAVAVKLGAAEMVQSLDHMANTLLKLVREK